MAEKTTQQIDFGSFGAGGGSRYPWSEWLDGNTYLCKQGEDFDIPVKRFRLAVNTAARKRGLIGRTKDMGDGVVAIKAEPKSEAHDADQPASRTTRRRARATA